MINEISVSYGVPIMLEYDPNSQQTFGKFICQEHQCDSDDWYALVDESSKLNQ